MPDTSAIPQSINPLDPASIAAVAQALRSQFSPQVPARDAIIKQISDPSFFPNATGPSSADQQLASTLPTEADIAAQNASLQARGAADLDQRLRGVAAPQQGLYQQPNLPQLQLPDQPQTARPQVSPLAQLLSIGASFASPSHAGQFNAAALDGAIQGANEENARRQQRDKVDVMRRTVLYDAAMTNARERQRVSEANVDVAAHNSVADYTRKLMLAKSGSEAMTAGNLADSMKKFAEENDPAFKARDRVKAAIDNLDAQGKAFAERAKGAAELMNALRSDDREGPGLGAKVLEEAMKGTLAASKDRALDARRDKTATEALHNLHERLKTETSIAAAHDVTSRANNASTQASENARNAARIEGDMKRQVQKQEFDAKQSLRDEATKNGSPREKVLAGNIQRHQALLQGLEDQLRAARASLASTVNNEDKVDNLTRRQWEQRVRELLKQGAERQEAILKDQAALEEEMKTHSAAVSGGKVRYNPLTGRFE